MKKIITLLISVIVVFGSALSASATNEILPIEDGAGGSKMAYISDCKSNLAINSSGTATMFASVSGISGTTKTVVSANLQQYKGGTWTTIKTLSATSNSSSANVNGTHTVASGYSYRVSATVTAYSGTAYETKTVNSSISGFS